MNFAHFCEFWCFSLGKQARFTLNFCSGMPLGKVHELTFSLVWFAGATPESCGRRMWASNTERAEQGGGGGQLQWRTSLVRSAWAEWYRTYSCNLRLLHIDFTWVFRGQAMFLLVKTEATTRLLDLLASELAGLGPIPKIRFSKFPGGRTKEHLVNSVFCCFFLRKIDKIFPKTRFSKRIFGDAAGSTKLDRPHCKQFWLLLW